MNASIDRYAVIGNPVGHSLSPRIHSMFARQTGQRLSYDAILVPLDGLKTSLENFERAGGKGLNVTLPFKAEACALMQRLSPRAQRAQAVNTILIGERGQRFGHNTDGVGLVRDLKQNLGLALRDADILLLGAGGAAHGVMEPLLEERPARLLIANRSPRKAHDLAEHFSALGRVDHCDLASLRKQAFDLVINATSAGINGELPPLPSKLFRKHAVFYDMMYGTKSWPFLSWASEQGARLATDGIGMLVEQAAEAFWLWRGVHPKTTPVIEVLRRPTHNAAAED